MPSLLPFLARTPIARRFYLASILVLLVLIGCQTTGTDSDGIVHLDPPVTASSGQPHLHVDESQQLWMSWVEPLDTSRHALRYASFDGTAWSEPETAATGEEWFVNWADVPSILTLPDGRMAAHYLISNGPNIFAYDVHIAQTTAGGAWQEAVAPHHDGTQTEHGFVSMLPWEDQLLAVWLDGREMDPEEGGHGGGPMTLRSALLDASGEPQEKFLLDDRVCECCPTSAVRTEEGALVAYRDRSEDEIRNIGLVHFDGERWSEPYLLHDDGWQLDGCPVNGPALAASGNYVAAAWFSAAEGAPRVQVRFSDDGGRTFGDPILIDDDRPSGQVDLVLLNDASAIVSWYGRDEDEPALRVRRVFADGHMTDTETVVQPMPPVRAGIPRMARTGDKLYFAWTDRQDDTEETHVQVVQLPVTVLQ